MKMSKSIAVHHRYICIFVCTTYLIFVTFGLLIFIHEQILLEYFVVSKSLIPLVVDLKVHMRPPFGPHFAPNSCYGAPPNNCMYGRPRKCGDGLQSPSTICAGLTTGHRKFRH